jgi:transcriptional regulator with XRE-family HTH domain
MQFASLIDSLHAWLRVVKLERNVRNMGTKAVRKGPIAERVAETVRTHRLRRRLSHRQLSARLAELGHPILPSGIAKIEDGSRRVDVDDLVALALALRVSMSRLLLPATDTGEPVALTEAMTLDFTEAWRWSRGELLPGVPPEPDRDGDGWVKVPAELQDFVEWGHPDMFVKQALPVDVYQTRLSTVLHALVAEIENVRFRGPKPDQDTDEGADVGR